MQKSKAGARDRVLTWGGGRELTEEVLFEQTLKCSKKVMRISRAFRSSSKCKDPGAGAWLAREMVGSRR